MKTILLPTDFSEASRFASEYIFNLTKSTDVKFHLIHSYAPPSATGALISIEDIVRKDAEECLKKERDWMITVGFKENQITSEVFFGEFTTVINREAKKTNAAYITLGTTGASGLKEIIGSNASNLMKFANIPVLAIPYKCDTPKGDILFPVNLSEENEFASTDLLIYFSKIYKASIHVFHTSNATNDSYTLIEKQKTKLTQLLNETNVKIKIEDCENVPNKILELIEGKDYAMLAMTPHKYGLLKRIFKSSITSQIATKTNIPLLTIP